MSLRAAKGKLRMRYPSAPCHSCGQPSIRCCTYGTEGIRLKKHWRCGARACGACVEHPPDTEIYLGPQHPAPKPPVAPPPRDPYLRRSLATRGGAIRERRLSSP